MFRMPPQVDPAEEQRRVSADVRNNFVMFAIMCGLVRLAPFVLEKVRNA